MIFSERKFKKTNLALALLVAMHGNFALAQDMPAEASSVQDGNRLADERESSTVTWPLLSGESVQSLSVLFYPKNKKMQRIFVQRTLQLSHEIRPNLSAYTTTNQASLIIIPNIKYLAKHSGKIRHASVKKIHHDKPATQPALHMSYGLKDADKFALTPEMQTKYEDLVKRNEKLKQELYKLNAKLAHLQQVMAALNVEAKRIDSLPVPVAKENVLPPPAAPIAVASSTQPVVAAVVPAQEPEKPKPRVIKHLTTPEAPAQINTSADGESFVSEYGMPILLGLLALGAILGAFLFRRKKLKASSYYSSEQIQPMDAKEFASVEEDDPTPITVDFSLTTSEFSSSISDNDLDAIMSLKSKEEGDLVIEQAKIYMNISREAEAIMILKGHIQAAPKSSLDHLLLLLDIYRSTNQKEAFIEAAQQLHQTFNVVSPTWDNIAVPMVIATSLMEFPHIIEQLMKLWGECDKSLPKMIEAKRYLDTLLTDNRENERAGFGMEVLKEIKLLRDILDIRDKFSNDKVVEGDI